MFLILQALVFTLLLLLSSTAQATTLPQCAVGCARADAIQARCDLTDASCLCKTSFAANVIQCTRTTSCSQAEQAQVSAILTEMCAAAVSSSSHCGPSVTTSSTSAASR
ncbi:hypothetical protein C8R45DRAFT_1023443 [Mycena sanguinolenta]|nr:hypothetical protein C8R45DRAFT_1023443 [Mycena sanguinolenta]